MIHDDPSNPDPGPEPEAPGPEAERLRGLLREARKIIDAVLHADEPGLTSPEAAMIERIDAALAGEP